MFTRFSILQLLVTTSAVAVLFSVIAAGIQQENSMGWGAAIALVLLLPLFLTYAVVTTVARVFCGLGNSLLGSLVIEAVETVEAVEVQRHPVYPDETPDSIPMERSSNGEVSDEE